VVVVAAGVGPDSAVLDVARGTGAATVAALRRVGSGGRVVGLDFNPETLAAARAKPGVEWVTARREPCLPRTGASTRW
jgi:ubiquinone/menaquinone biosynthesis C-methylase UbiE